MTRSSIELYENCAIVKRYSYSDELQSVFEILRSLEEY